MAFTGNENQSISLEEAAKLTKNYRDSVSEGTILSGYFSKSELLKILGQSGSVGMRYYYGRGDDGKAKLVLVGAKSDQDDLFEGEIAEHSIDCPPFCPNPNPLNT